MKERIPRAAIFGCQGPALSDWERGFFTETNPLGFILFARNCETPPQIRRLVEDLRESIGRSDAPVLIDQEGGRVQRLRPPEWRSAPPGATFGQLASRDLAAAEEAVALNTRLIAVELRALGIDVDCIPLLDLTQPETHVAIGDRAFSSDPDMVARLGRAVAETLLASGVMPVVKHMPGHGRATVDSHESLPVVSVDHDTLSRSDFAPFAALADLPWGMTAHVVYSDIDPNAPATTSRKVIEEVIRGEIGFDGLLLSDDLSMQALQGGLGERAAASLAAGCDIALHCNGDPAEMQAVAARVGPMTAEAQRRLAAGEARRTSRPLELDLAATEQELAHLLA